ncbi:MAG: 23S rRNA (adenine(2030)-N(6))-methyltransferase RlmJ [Pseudorhodoplanes sp.]|jgi:23S rRNA (adenine2030-N6)-methyltransferase|nr:23S rRNA (adenine(2030)-N(6))-methyltransferase RlmJ [Pseudorhodoplanes sp.]
MNYRHAFHAGNFADVVKHAVLARIVGYLQQKDAPIRIIDTHAGGGLYDLHGEEASRSGEWRDGIARVVDAQFDPAARDLIAPYLDAVKSFNPGRLKTYPGSPALLRTWLRRNDRLIACELEPSAIAALNRALGGDNRCKVIEIDGWTALTAYIPPKERRGLVLIDPPFEEPNEYARLAAALGEAWRKWPTGTYLAWYPVKDPKDVTGFLKKLLQHGIEKMLRMELIVAAPTETARLRGTGMIAINPPWTLAREVSILLPVLATIFAGGAGSTIVAPLPSQTR